MSKSALPRAIEANRNQIERLCRTYHVRRLEVFGSAVRDDFDPDRSDVDFVVEFESDPDLNLFEPYMDLRHELADLLGRPVDLVMLSAVRNPHIQSEIEAHRSVTEQGMVPR